MQALVAFLIMLVLDLSWISLNSQKYNNLVQKVQNKPLKLNRSGAFVAYFLMYLSLAYLVLPATKDDSFISALKTGGLFGFLAYGIFNATNYAMFNDYTLSTAIIDTLWGTIVYTLATYAGKKLIA